MTYQSTPKNLSEPFLAQLKKYSIMCFILFVILYGVSRLVPILRGPVLSVNLTDGQSFSNPLVRINGFAKNAHQTTINGNPITTSIDGSFATDIVLGNGSNTLTISAEDKFGKQISRAYTVMLQEAPDAPSLATNTVNLTNY